MGTWTATSCPSPRWSSARPGVTGPPVLLRGSFVPMRSPSTPHTANPWQTAQPLLAARITENVRRFAAGDELLGRVDLDAGY